MPPDSFSRDREKNFSTFLFFLVVYLWDAKLLYEPLRTAKEICFFAVCPFYEGCRDGEQLYLGPSQNCLDQDKQLSGSGTPLFGSDVHP